MIWLCEWRPVINEIRVNVGGDNQVSGNCSDASGPPIVQRDPRLPPRFVQHNLKSEAHLGIKLFHPTSQTDRTSDPDVACYSFNCTSKDHGKSLAQRSSTLTRHRHRNTHRNLQANRELHSASDSLHNAAQAPEVVTWKYCEMNCILWLRRRRLGSTMRRRGNEGRERPTGRRTDVLREPARGWWRT
jgi:hypothetical protein